LWCLESESDLLKRDTTSVRIRNHTHLFPLALTLLLKKRMTTESFMFVAGPILISGLITELLAVVSAPVGYQDESGFHIGTQASETAADGPWGNPS